MNSDDGFFQFALVKGSPLDGFQLRTPLGAEECKYLFRCHVVTKGGSDFFKIPDTVGSVTLGDCQLQIIKQKSFALDPLGNATEVPANFRLGSKPPRKGATRIFSSVADDGGLVRDIFTLENFV